MPLTHVIASKHVNTICASDQGYVGGRKHGWRQRTFFNGVHGLSRPQRQFCMLVGVVEQLSSLAIAFFAIVAK